MDFLTIALSFLFLFTLYQGFLSLTYSARNKKYPPGPTPLPLIGSLHKLGDQPHQSLAQLTRIHGPVMSLKLGRIITVVFSSSEATKEVLQKKDISFANRKIPDAVHAHNHSKFSVVCLPVAPQWRSLRKIMNSNIFSGSRLDGNQHLRTRKVEELIIYCSKSRQSGDAIDIGSCISNIAKSTVQHYLLKGFDRSIPRFSERV